MGGLFHITYMFILVKYGHFYDFLNRKLSCLDSTCKQCRAGAPSKMAATNATYSSQWPSQSICFFRLILNNKVGDFVKFNCFLAAKMHSEDNSFLIPAYEWEWFKQEDTEGNKWSLNDLKSHFLLVIDGSMGQAQVSLSDPHYIAATWRSDNRDFSRV